MDTRDLLTSDSGSDGTRSDPFTAALASVTTPLLQWRWRVGAEVTAAALATKQTGLKHQLAREQAMTEVQ